MLCIDQQPVITAMRQLLRNGRTMGIHEEPKFRTAFSHLILELGSGQSGLTHVLLLLVILCCEADIYPTWVFMVKYIFGRELILLRYKRCMNFGRRRTHRVFPPSPNFERRG